MNKIGNPIGIYFTVNGCKDLSRYLKGNISHITESLDLSQMLNIIYNFASDICPSMLYRGNTKVKCIKIEKIPIIFSKIN